MTRNEKLRLCGGTFFTLLLEARKPLITASGHYAGKKDGLTEYETLIALARVAIADIPIPTQTEIKTIQGNASEFKKCENAGGGYFPFGNRTTIVTFDKRVKNEYAKALLAMDEFIYNYIDVLGEAKKDEALVRALVELISKDDSIKAEQEFYINEDGTPRRKSEIETLSIICFESFLLGVYHFAITRPEENTIGQNTFNIWCPPRQGAKRVYIGRMGEDWPIEIELTYCDKSEFQEAINDEGAVVETVVVEDNTSSNGEANSDEQPRVATQMNFTFNVTGDHNSFYNHVDTVNNYHGGRKDGK